MKRPTSLRRPLILYPLAFHLATLTLSFAVILAVTLRIDSGGPYADERITPVIARAIERQDSGRLVVRMTPELSALRAESPGLWFMAEDDQGRTVTLGPVPPRYAALAGGLSGLSYGQFRDRAAPHDLTAVLRREAGPAGMLTILGHGKLNALGLVFLITSNLIVLPIFLLLVLTSLLVTPWIVRRSLAGVDRIARDAARIDTAHRGLRLNETDAPKEIAPLVQAVNAALRRLDEGYERQRRFIASAAHELRTPIAILRARVETSGTPETRSLGPGVQRLATLAEQLLDLQRLDHGRQDDPLDLLNLIRGVVADLAPVLAPAHTIEVQTGARRSCRGDAPALERVVTNLIQNAFEHGGRHVVIRVDGAAFEVEDDGPGIPPDERERVFEPFHRLRPRASGSGLGLSLVQEVVSRHGGRVSLSGAATGGTIVRVDLAPGVPPSTTGRG